MLTQPAPSAEAASGTFWGEIRTQRVMVTGLVAYLVLTHLTIGLRVEHVVLTALMLGLVMRGGKTLWFTVLALPVVATGVSYDFFRLLIPLRGSVHIADLYGAELALFGINGQVPALWLAGHTHPAADFVTGLAYMIYLYVPMVVAAVHYAFDKRQMLFVGAAFFFTNVVGMAIYLLYPAAPPWYVAAHGLGPIVLDAAPDAAGAARFDALLGIHYFEHFYARSANVFGAMPSLHVAYPMSTLLASLGRGRKWTWPLATFTVVVAFAAIYLQHHYILDVVAGVACAGAGYLIARRLVQPTETHAGT